MGNRPREETMLGDEHQADELAPATSIPHRFDPICHHVLVASHEPEEGLLWVYCRLCKGLLESRFQPAAWRLRGA
jgi:hypothetical protein